MRINWKHIFIFLISFTVGMSFFAHESLAAGVVEKISAALVPSAEDIVADLANMGLSVAGVILSIAGALLNVSIVITLHIKDFVDNTPAVYEVWRIIRDISGIFFIFLLLFAAIQIILDQKSNYKSLITSIVLAGILVNFSFFFISVLIDASNVVSQAIYNSMLPGYEKVDLRENGLSKEKSGLNLLTSRVTSGRQVQNSKTDTIERQGGISDIFMNSLKIPNLYDLKSKGRDNAAAIGPLKILIIGVVGVLMMITTAVSFTLASIAFIIRLVILIFILAFSPLWFIAWVIPQLRDHANTIMNQLKSQLIFMPLYLLLMYVALMILNNNSLFGMGYVPNLSDTESTSLNWAFGYVTLGINFAIVIIILNLPLFVALSMGGWATKNLNVGKWGADAIWGKFGSRVGSKTAGRLAYSMNNSESMNKYLAKNSMVARYVSGKLGQVSNMGFGEKKGGYEDRLKAEKKSIEDLHKRIGTVERGEFSPGPEGDVEFKAAKERAEQRQQTYRTSLKNQSKRGIIYAMLDRRGSSHTVNKLEEAAEKAAKKKAKSNAEKLKKELNAKNKEIEAEISKLNKLMDSDKIETLNDQIRKNKELISKAEEDISVGLEIERSEKDKKLEDGIDDVKKKLDKE